MRFMVQSMFWVDRLLYPVQCAKVCTDTESTHVQLALLK